MPVSAVPVAIITGAGSGIGVATSRLLAREGWTIVLAGRRAEQLAAAASTLPGDSHLVVPTDIADPDACTALARNAVDRLGRIDVLINNAGFAPLVPLGEQSPELVRQAFDINALGPANLILACWPHMAARRSGRIINVSSMATADPFPGFFGYAAAKASVELMVRSIATEGALLGIRAFAVAPGAVETPMLRAIVPESSLPSSRTLSPEAVARVVADCALGRRDADNGSTIRLPSP